MRRRANALAANMTSQCMFPLSNHLPTFEWPSSQAFQCIAGIDTCGFLREAKPGPGRDPSDSTWTKPPHTEESHPSGTLRRCSHSSANMATAGSCKLLVQCFLVGSGSEKSPVCSSTHLRTSAQSPPGARHKLSRANLCKAGFLRSCSRFCWEYHSQETPWSLSNPAVGSRKGFSLIQAVMPVLARLVAKVLIDLIAQTRHIVHSHYSHFFGSLKGKCARRSSSIGIGSGHRDPSELLASDGEVHAETSSRGRRSLVATGRWIVCN